MKHYKHILLRCFQIAAAALLLAEIFAWKPTTTENSHVLLDFVVKVFSRISGKVEGDQTVIIPIISKIENPAIVGPSQNDGMSGLGTAAAQIVPDFRKNGFVAESGGGSMVMAIS